MASQTIFIGSIPFDATEQQISEIFSTVGAIKAIRLVSDRETGKPKGYAFLEYHDSAAAESAVRNLNGSELSGRQLRVGWAEEQRNDRRDRDRDDFRRKDEGWRRGGFPPGTGPAGTKPVGAATAATAGAHMTAIVGGPPTPGPNQTCVNQVLGGMSPLQLYELMSQMRGLIRSDPERARRILLDNPQLTKALFQAQILLGMVKPPPGVQLPPHDSAATSGSAPGPAAPPAAPLPGPAPTQPPPTLVAPPPAPAIPQPVFSLPPGAQPPPYGLPGGPVQVIAIDGGAQGLQYINVQPGALPPQSVLQVPQPVAMAPPPQVVQPAPAPVQQVPQPAAAPAVPLPMEQQAILQQVMRMSQEQIDALPEATRQQVLQVKQMLQAAQQQG